MKRTSIVLVACGLTGCPESRVEQPNISVFRFDLERACYQACGGEAMVEPKFADLADSDLCDDNANVAEAGCSVSPGRDRLKVVVDYGLIEFDRQENVPNVALDTLLDGVKIIETAQVPSQRSDSQRAFAVTEVIAPARRPGSLRFNATIAAGFHRASDPVALGKAALEVSFVTCGDTCEFAAGSGKATVRLDVPRGIAPPKLVSTVNEIQSSAPVEFAVTGEAGTPVFAEVTIPDDPGPWSLAIQTAEFPLSLPATATIIERAPLLLGAIELGSDPSTAMDGEFPRRLALEPDPECRAVLVVVGNDQLDSGQSISVTTDAGVLDGGGQQTTVTVGDDGLGTAVLRLGETVVDNAVVELTAKLTVDNTQELAVARTWKLERLLASGAELFLPASPQATTLSGTKAVTLTGLLKVPDPLLPSQSASEFSAPKFSAGSSVIVRLQANGQDGPHSCGPAQPNGNINCDRRELPGVNRGGCVWTPNPVSVDPDGAFAVSLTAGQCFVGDLDVQIYAQSYPPAFDPTQCIGPQTPPPSAPQALGQPGTVVYEDTDADASDSSSG